MLQLNYVVLLMIASRCIAFHPVRFTSTCRIEELSPVRSILTASRVDGQVGEVAGDVALTEEIDLPDDEALIQRVMDDVMETSGVELDQLINPSKVVNLERDLVKLAAELETCTDQTRIVSINEEIEKKKSSLFIEKRSVMRGWLKGLFVGQSVLAVIISLAAVYNAIPGQDLFCPYVCSDFGAGGSLSFLLYVPASRLMLKKKL